MKKKNQYHRNDRADEKLVFSASWCDKKGLAEDRKVEVTWGWKIARLMLTGCKQTHVNIAYVIWSRISARRWVLGVTGGSVCSVGGVIGTGAWLLRNLSRVCRLKVSMAWAYKIPNCEVVVPRKVLKNDVNRSGRLRCSVFKDHIFVRSQCIQSWHLNQHMTLIKLSTAGMVGKEWAMKVEWFEFDFYAKRDMRIVI